MDSNEVVRLIEEQRPDFALPGPHCNRPVDGGGRVLVEGFKPRLLAHCGGSGYEFTGRGCLAKVAWDPDQQVTDTRDTVCGSDFHDRPAASLGVSVGQLLASGGTTVE